MAHEFNPKGIETAYLPSNTTSLIQPLELRVIRTFRVHYTWFLWKGFVMLYKRTVIERTSWKSGRITPLKMTSW